MGCCCSAARERELAHTGAVHRAAAAARADPALRSAGKVPSRRATVRYAWQSYYGTHARRAPRSELERHFAAQTRDDILRH